MAARTSDRRADETRHPGRNRKQPGASGIGAVAIDINKATADDLRRLPGIGPVLAARIVASRDTNGRFESIDDLGRIPGLGPAKIERFRSFVTVTP